MGRCAPWPSGHNYVLSPQSLTASALCKGAGQVAVSLQSRELTDSLLCVCYPSKHGQHLLSIARSSVRYYLGPGLGTKRSSSVLSARSPASDSDNHMRRGPWAYTACV